MNYLQSYQSELKLKQLNSYVCFINNNNFNFDLFSRAPNAGKSEAE